MVTGGPHSNPDLMTDVQKAKREMQQDLSFLSLMKEASSYDLAEKEGSFVHTLATMYKKLGAMGSRRYIENLLGVVSEAVSTVASSASSRPRSVQMKNF